MGRRLNEETVAVGMAPLLGFIILVGVVGGTFLISPSIIRFMTTQVVVAGLFGQILPVSFPAGWPYILQRLVVTSFGALVAFILVVILIFTIQGQDVDPTDVNPEDIRNEKKASLDRKKKAGRRRRY